MGKITELSHGSLNGLRRQTNECLKNAYNKGYEDGKKEVIESHGEQEYNRGIEDASNLLADADERFIRECFPSESNWNLVYLIAKYGLAVVTKEFKKWQAEINQTEEEIKLGDGVFNIENPEAEFFVFKIEDNLISGVNMTGVYTKRPVSEWKKTGKNFFELVRYVNKAFSIKGENQDE